MAGGDTAALAALMVWSHAWSMSSYGWEEGAVAGGGNISGSESSELESAWESCCSGLVRCSWIRRY